MKQRVISFVLCAAMVLSLVPAAAFVGYAEQPAAGLTVLTAYSRDAVTVDGAITDNGWKMYPLTGGVSMGAQWQKKVMYLAIPKDATALTVNGKAVALSGEAAEGQAQPTASATGNYLELSVPMADLGLVKPPVGAKIPFTLNWGESASCTGNLELSDIDWFAVETEANILTVYTDRNGNESRGRQTLERDGNRIPLYSDKLGTQKVAGGYQFKAPAADDGAAEYAGVRTYLQYQAGKFTPLAIHDQAIHVEFDYYAAAMPAYTVAEAKELNKLSKLYPGYGFNITLADAYADPDNGNHFSNIIRTAIVNTADGLKLLVLNKSEKYTELALGKHIGDAFRFAMRWEMDGSLNVWVDGVKIGNVADAQTSMNWYAEQCIVMNTIRRDTADKGDFDITVTNMAVGKCQDPYTIPTTVAPGPAVTDYANTVTVDGKTDEREWHLNNIILDDDGKEAGKFGALWSDDAVHMAVDAGEADSVVLKLGEESLIIDMKAGTASGTIPVTVAVNGSVAELSIVHRALDIIHAEPGAGFDLIVMLGDAVYSGGISFNGKLEWFLTDMAAQVGNPVVTGGFDRVINNNSWNMAGVSKEEITGGYRFKDLFVEGQTNQKGSGRSYVYWQNNDAFDPLDDITCGSYSEFEFYAEKMPAWSDAVAAKKMEKIDTAVYGSRGLSWQVAGKQSDGSIHFTSMSIYNTADGLKLAVKKADGKLSLVGLSQKVGDKFRIGTMCHADGSVDVYVNGTLVTATSIANARLSVGASSLNGVVDGGIAISMIQAEKYVSGTANGRSAADDMIVEITNIAMAKEVPQKAASLPATSTTVETAYTASTVAVDGKLDEANWYMGSNVGQTGQFAAKWDAANLYLAVDTNGAELGLKINNKTVDLSAEGVESAADSFTEVKIPLSYLGVQISDYGTEIPITVTLGEDSFTGKLKLVSVDWVLAESQTHPVTLKTRTTGALRGTEVIDGGYRLYDLYDPVGGNVGNNHTYLVYRKSEGAKWALLENQESGTWLSFDFRADSMPEYASEQPSKYYACYGLAITMTDNVVGKSAHNMACMGIHNSPQGLILVISHNEGNPLSVPLNRYEGDTLHMSVVWRHNRDIVVYCDGGEVAYVKNAEIATGGVTSSPSVLVRMIRNANPAASEEDDLDISITNVAAGNAKYLSLMELLSWDTIKGGNTGKNSIASDLVLPATLTDGILSTDLTWSSSNEAVISSEGKLVAVPETLGELVTLTATASNGDTMTFELIVPGTGEEAGDVLVVEHDRNPAVGAAKPLVTHRFTLDTNNNSVVLDMKVKKDISVVELRDVDATARFREDTVTLWVSDDNVTYTEIKDFKLMQSGNTWYFYDFAAEGRYVKVHNTHFEGSDAEFVRGLAGMLAAYHDPLLGTGFTETARTVTNNTGKERYDYAYTISGVEAQRVLLDGELLYHYVENGNTVVRIPYLAAGESATVKVLTGSADAVNTENKENVYEVIYGTREGQVVFDAHWIQTLNDGSMITFFSDDYNESHKTIAYSYDGGRTWVNKRVVQEVEEWIASLGGFVYNHITGRILFYGVGVPDENGNRSLNFVASDNNGQTWYKAGKVETDRNYLVSYTQGLILSTYDGDGPNVDIVFTTGSRFDDATGVFCIICVYTTDGGYTWKHSEDLITVDKTTGKSEGGTSEGCIIERDDGVLVLYSRNQDEASEHFAMSYSYDHGITWSPSNPESAKLSTMYTTNTQPQAYKYNGAQLMTWGGNSVMGGDSYIRTPMTVGVTYDGGENYRNLQDLYMAYCMQGLSFTTQHCAINQIVQKSGEDTLLVSFWDQTNNRKVENDVIIRVDDFTDYFYRTKGAFDSFEHGTVKYEGWDTNSGITRVSNAVAATHGDYVMELLSGYATRSVPYIQDGKISMMLYVADGGHLSVGLQCAYSNIEGKCAPLGFRADNYQVTFFGADTPSGLTLKNGWNDITVDLSLAKDGKATLTVNGESKAMPVDQTVGDYVCFVSVAAGSTVYLDEFCVIDDEDAVIPENKVITAADVTLGSELTYNGKEQMQTVTVKDGITYYVTGNKATEAGTYELTVHATGSYSGKVTLKWSIADAVCPDAIEGEYAEEINLWLKIFVPDSFKENDAYLVMTKQGGFGVETVTVKGSELGNADARGRYLLKMGIASGEMTSKVTYEFYDADGNKMNIVTSSGNNMGDAATFSLLNYARSMLRSGTDAQKKMVAAMLTYGGYAQKYFNVDAENPAYNLLTEMGMTVPSLDGVTADLITDRTIVADGGNGIKATGMQAFLDSAIYLRVYFTLAEGADIEDYKFVLTYAKPDGTVDTMELEAGYEAGKNRYYADIEDIPAAYLDYMYNITVTNTKTNATYSVTTSVMVWMRNALNSATDENHKNLLKAIYLYNQAANEFFGK